MSSNAQEKKKALQERISRLQDALCKGREYLETGKHATWHGFRPLFQKKLRDGELTPPHQDWVKNVFLPRRERALRQTEQALQKLLTAENRAERAPRKAAREAKYFD